MARTTSPIGAVKAVDPDQWATADYPPGAQAAGQEVTFAVYSKHATRVLLEVYETATGGDAVHEVWLARNPADDFWRARLANLRSGAFYAFRCWGPNWEYSSDWRRGNSAAGFVSDVDAAGNRFNPNKVLFDPYAREISHDRVSAALLAAGEDGGMYGTGGGDYRGVPRRTVDTGRWAPKGIVVLDRTPTGRRPFLPAEKAAIYEAHPRGFTRHPSASRLTGILAGIPGFENVPDVPEDLRGTYRGAGLMAPYLKALGFTTIELLPVHETENDTNPEQSAGGNYWGYMSFGFFAPDRRYAADPSPGGPTREFKEMVRAFHEQGIEVYLDVVYNHTGEGGNWGDVDTTGFVSMGGFDTSEYYVLTPGNYLVDGATGCGNQLNFSAEAAQRLVVDSLSYWISEMGIDGFRFDLAPVLGRTPNAFERQNWDYQKRFFPQHPLLARIRELAERSRVEVIAEAWDLWGYEVGNFPNGWGEWNGRYRDAVRRFLKGDGNTQSFVEMLNGDYANFQDQGGPQRSINFIVAHDGFTLADLVSYNQKNNLQNWPFGPSDGGNDDNQAWDSGGNAALRRQRHRNFWTVQFLSRGVPMIVAGDEFGRTQNGNNNSYNLDSVANWSNYQMIASHSPHALATEGGGAYHDNFASAATPPAVNPLFHFARYMARLRQGHPALKQRCWGDLTMNDGRDVTYLFRKSDGFSYLDGADRCVWLRIDGSSVRDHDFLVLINMWREAVNFAVPRDSASQLWVRLVDTDAWAEAACNCWSPAEATVIHDGYLVHPWSIVVLEERKR
ncbi:glycogen-debranching protein [Accumulibacter sp.]|uniref:glycogen debranching protein n=1 Tax=Accumulibacter sp. TaxID=2053492 RepID=UPI0025D60422|nr:isoamylase [Accumulibacter sp.]MCM8594563.1 isoamylase [Accumulibacter sp.]MCM8627411.1 isoamylase [Accumulibacter sp.]MDS4048709.1 isoamylase [Accumulibacter sp.]